MSLETWSDEERNAYEAEVLREIAEKAAEEDPITTMFELREFVSNREYGKTRKRPKEVRLVRHRNTGRAQTLRDVPTGRLDVLAEILLAGMLPSGANAFEELVSRLEAAARRSNGRK